jgi:hypothetical protein
MIKQIRTEQLKPGMYIHDLNCGWLDHSFVSNAFAVRDQATVNKIVELGIRELYIDTLKGADVWEARRSPMLMPSSKSACRKSPRSGQKSRSSLS